MIREEEGRGGFHFSKTGETEKGRRKLEPNGGFWSILSRRLRLQCLV